MKKLIIATMMVFTFFPDLYAAIPNLNQAKRQSRREQCDRLWRDIELLRELIKHAAQGNNQDYLKALKNQLAEMEFMYDSQCRGNRSRDR